ncbi:SCO family protein [Kaarinaea lacus]
MLETNMEHVSENQRQFKLVSPKILWVTGILLLVLAEPLLYGNFFNDKNQYPDTIRDVVYPELKPLQAFKLVDHKNHMLGLEHLAGGWTFLFFGYTQCPDICPATLSQLTRLSQSIHDNAAGNIRPNFLLVSVDPERDKVNVLRDYINYFDDSFIAATGDIKDIEAFEKQFGVTHRYGERDASDNYAVTHSAEIFLVDPETRIVAKFTPPLSIQRVTQQYGELVNYFQPENKHI